MSDYQREIRMSGRQAGKTTRLEHAALSAFLLTLQGQWVRVVKIQGKACVGRLDDVGETVEHAVTVRVRHDATDDRVPWDNVDTLSVLSDQYDGRLKDARRLKSGHRHGR